MKQLIKRKMFKKKSLNNMNDINKNDNFLNQ